MRLWVMDAACSGTDPLMWEEGLGRPRKNGATNGWLVDARRVCARCPVTLECLADAILTEHTTARVTIRAGMTGTHRTSLWQELLSVSIPVARKVLRDAQRTDRQRIA